MKNGKKDMPLPLQAEIIWICTDIPDQAQIDTARKGEIDKEALTAARAPDDTSKSPDKTAFIQSGALHINGSEHKVPAKAEKVITQAETLSIF